ncbi:MAG: FixH family protein [Acidobacteriia bacterium]|nr:FixH family protein [Terriglobia bacterium]
MKRSLILLFLAICTLGCSKQKSQNQTHSPAAPKDFAILEQTSKETGWKAALSYDPSPAVIGKETAFTLRLTNPSGAPVDGAQVNFALLMPLMDMKAQRFEARNSGGGIYNGTGAFSMNGIWIVQANIEKNSAKAHLEFEVHVGQ